jgi:hypothetical protein
MVRGGWGVATPGRPAKFGNRAPGRVRSQATALTHQGPLNLGEPRALALLPHEG